MERTVVFAWMALALALDEDATAAGAVVVAAGAAAVSVAEASCAVAMVLWVCEEGGSREDQTMQVMSHLRRSPYDAGCAEINNLPPPATCAVPLACAVVRSWAPRLGLAAMAEWCRGVCVVLVEVVHGSTRVTKGPSLGRHMSSHRSVH